MKNFRLFLFGAACVAMLSSCNAARVDGRFAAAPADGTVIAKTLENGDLRVLDTIKIASDGTFRYSIKLPKGQPEFVYLYCGDNKVASLLLSSSDRVSLQCDTIGASWSVSGSDDCVKLLENEKELAALVAGGTVTGRDYLEYYRKKVKYVLANSHSLTVVPVLFQKIGVTPVFMQDSDGVLFGAIADSLSTVYPNSRYVGLLKSEASRRQQHLDLRLRIEGAEAMAFPELHFPDLEGNQVYLTKYASDRTLVVFWDASDPGNKIFNQDILKPLYDKYSASGLKIYAVNIGGEKSHWAMVCREQRLPWMNVFDSKGSSVLLYGVTNVPTVFIIRDGQLERIENVSLSAIAKKL